MSGNLVHGAPIGLRLGRGMENTVVDGQVSLNARLIGGVSGGSTFNLPTISTCSAAAGRLAQILKPWNVVCTILPAGEANQPRTLTEDEALTWCGLEYAGASQIKPGLSNSPVQVGIAEIGPMVLLGTPADNSLVKFVAEQRFLPFPSDAAALPGPGRGCVAWQREAVGVNQESVTLIAYDADGMSEAVGTLYEMLAGLEPLTLLAPPHSSTITPATRTRHLLELTPAWAVVLPDRVTAQRVAAGAIEALTDASGAAKHMHCGPQDITALTWDGPCLLVGDAGGRLSALPSE